MKNIADLFEAVFEYFMDVAHENQEPAFHFSRNKRTALD